MNNEFVVAQLCRGRLFMAVAVLFLAASLLSVPAEARSIRVDSGDEWSAQSNDATGQIGFELDFFGVQTSTVEISRDGQVSFGGATISPFLVDGLDSDFFWQNTTESPLPGFPDIQAGFRVCWGCFSDGAEFQLALFDLGGGQYAMEFNYAGLPPAENAFIGYDNGQDVNFDMLAALGLDFPDWAGFESALCPEGDPEGPTDALACNNYDFSTDSATLQQGYGGYFAQDPSFGDPVLGRYFFLLNESADVPEPDSALLLIAGLAMIRLVRRKRRRTSLL